MKAPEHVLMTADAVGGVWTYALELSRALAKEGTRVTLAAVGPSPAADQREEARRIPHLNLLECAGRLEWMEDPWSDVASAGRWLQAVAQRIQPDIVHLNDYSHGALEWPCPSVVVAHSCVVSWWNAVHAADPPPAWSRYRQRVRAGLLGADLVTAVSHSLGDAISLHYGVPRPAVVRNGRSASQYLPAAKEEFVLTSGRVWDEAKNIRALSQAAAQIHWPVYLAGDTQRPAGGTADTIRLNALGRLPEQTLRGWFSRAAIYALPALYEPFGLSVLEAALSGCALVLGDIASLREIWGDAAVFVNGRDPEALTHAINDLIARAERRQQLASLARARALELTPEQMAQGYLDVYAAAERRHRASQEAAETCAS